jgi:hypothetical protein
MTGALSTFALQLETAQKVPLAQSSLNDTGETSKRLAKANHLVIELTDKVIYDIKLIKGALRTIASGCTCSNK